MTGAIETETYVVRNDDGSVSLDPWAGKSREELKRRCGELCRSLDQWQRFAMILFDQGKDGLLLEEQAQIKLLIEAYSDDEAPALTGNDSKGGAA